MLVPVTAARVDPLKRDGYDVRSIRRFMYIIRLPPTPSPDLPGSTTYLKPYLEATHESF